ncbi:hypothetical protein BD289DRAFT_113548 [Coniella lustricola]|uniref:Secreted protein n=1 Tax=Coniella lustricola TaxID=2025994 RepID=A0A2T3AGK2_9PEZI|nr:hypothetical protein BD289DRAFT_113548 [Coniella lustricola]
MLAYPKLQHRGLPSANHAACLSFLFFLFFQLLSRATREGEGRQGGGRMQERGPPWRERSRASICRAEPLGKAPEHTTALLWTNAIAKAFSQWASQIHQRLVQLLELSQHALDKCSNVNCRRCILPRWCQRPSAICHLPPKVQKSYHPCRGWQA